MRLRQGWPGAATALLACSLLACYDGAARGGKSRSDVVSASWCNALCSAYGRCEGSTPFTCSSNCKAANQGFFARSSQASLEFQTECLQVASCTADFEELIDECSSEAFSALEPSADAVELCALMQKPFFECAWFSTPDSCERFHTVFSAPALAAEQECATASCEELGACIEAQLYSFGE